MARQPHRRRKQGTADQGGVARSLRLDSSSGCRQYFVGREDSLAPPGPGGRDTKVTPGVQRPSGPRDAPRPTAPPAPQPRPAPAPPPNRQSFTISECWAKAAPDMVIRCRVLRKTMSLKPSARAPRENKSREQCVPAHLIYAAERQQRQCWPLCDFSALGLRFPLAVRLHNDLNAAVFLLLESVIHFRSISSEQRWVMTKDGATLPSSIIRISFSM